MLQLLLLSVAMDDLQKLFSISRSNFCLIYLSSFADRACVKVYMSNHYYIIVIKQNFNYIIENPCHTLTKGANHWVLNVPQGSSIWGV